MPIAKIRFYKKISNCCAILKFPLAKLHVLCCVLQVCMFYAGLVIGRATFWLNNLTTICLIDFC